MTGLTSPVVSVSVLLDLAVLPVGGWTCLKKQTNKK